MRVNTSNGGASSLIVATSYDPNFTAQREDDIAESTRSTLTLTQAAGAREQRAETSGSAVVFVTGGVHSSTATLILERPTVFTQK
jgi:hypothetical protein